MEKVKWIDGYEGLYQITSYGRVISAKRIDLRNRPCGRVLKPILQKGTGYYAVSLYKEGKQHVYSVHRLVAKAFIPNPENKPCIDHLDNDKQNNHVDNLRWATYKENMNNTITVERSKHKSKENLLRGAANHFSRRIAAYTLDGEFIGEYESSGEAKKALGLPKNTFIGRVCRGERKHTHGYVFKYLSEARIKANIPNNGNRRNKPIVQLDLDGNVIAEYESACEASRVTGFHQANISRTANGEYKQHKGFLWRYK